MRTKQKRKNPLAIVQQIEESSTPLLYISGPITGRDERNVKAFVDAQCKLWDAGYRAIIPHDVVLDKEASWLVSMAKCVNAMTQADGVALLDDWETSDGAKIEVLLADRGGLPVATVDEWCEGLEVA